MQEQKRKTPQLKFAIILAVGVSVVIMFTITPWNFIPTEVTENVKVIAVTGYGCVGESVLGRSVVVENCQASVGDIVTATFNVPAGQINGYLTKLEARQNPMVDNWDTKVNGIGMVPVP